MPVQRKRDQERPAEYGGLLAKLVAEWTEAATNPQPIILEEGGGREPWHVFVVWDAWTELAPELRSEMIMEAFPEAHPDDSLLDVTVAMGLTTAEADRMGIKYD